MRRQPGARDPAAAGAERALRPVAEVARSVELEELAAWLAHHVNQPLGAVAAFAQAGCRMLSSENPPVEQAVAIFREIARLALEAGADVGRIRARYTAEVAAASRQRLEELVEAIDAPLHGIAAGYHGRLEIDVGPGLPEIRVDAPRIQYVVMSLVRSGFAAADPRGGTPHVRVEARAEVDGVITSVIDDGLHPLMADQDAFEPSLAAPAPAPAPALGLSLAASRSIIEAHRGTIGFEKLRTGGRTWFRLPAAGA
jgi:C4-dicarboxylate-specific signal transduction histidine kinase